MPWVTLVVSRYRKLFPHYQKCLEEYGYRNIIFTDSKSDGLYSMIRELNPKYLFVDSYYKKCDTPFWITDIHKHFKKQNIIVVSLAEYPDDLAMYCIVNGAKSYVNKMDGMDEFNRGMREILYGNEYISPAVKERQRLRYNCCIKPTGHLTGGQIRLIRVASNGWKTEEIARTLEISTTSVEVRKSEAYTAMNVRNAVELTVKALRMELTSLDEIMFYGDDYQLKPLPEKVIGNR